MSLTEINIIGICILIFLFSLKMPVGFVMALVGFVGVSLIRGWDAGFSNISIIPIRQASSYLMTAIPLFILMGYLATTLYLNMLKIREKNDCTPLSGFSQLCVPGVWFLAFQSKRPTPVA